MRWLLLFHVFVACDESAEASTLDQGEKLAVLDATPAEAYYGTDIMAV